MMTEETTEPIRSPDDVLKVVANELAKYDREVFKSSILSNACSAICVHNHPSGSLIPSEEDKAVTAKLMV